jgi:hypothetical protein
MLPLGTLWTPERMPWRELALNEGQGATMATMKCPRQQFGDTYRSLPQNIGASRVSRRSCSCHCLYRCLYNCRGPPAGWLGSIEQAGLTLAGAATIIDSVCPGTRRARRTDSPGFPQEPLGAPCTMHRSVQMVHEMVHRMVQGGVGSAGTGVWVVRGPVAQ